MHPSRILVDDHGDHILIAGRDGEVDVFERREKRVYRYVKSWRALGGASDACIMRNHVFELDTCRITLA